MDAEKNVKSAGFEAQDARSCCCGSSHSGWSNHSVRRGQINQDNRSTQGTVRSEKVQPMIAMTNICKTYRMGNEDVHALDRVNFSVNSGEFVSVVGASGSGKSTLMNIMGLLDVPDEGIYYLAGRDVSSLSDNEAAFIRNRTIGFVFQDFSLLPTLTAFENVRLPLMYRGMKPSEAAERAHLQLERVGLESRAGHMPSQLSGGQQQRVAIARALAGEPAVLLADEPTGALDSRTSEDIMALLQESNGAGQTIVFITHNPDLAQRTSRMVRIGDGRVQEGKESV